MTTSTPDDPIIRLVDVHKRFGDLVVLDGVSMGIPRGLTTVLLGPSGTGKSVLIKHIVGLLEPDAGEVWVDDVEMGRASMKQRYAVRRRFGMMFQQGALFDNLTAGENVEFPLRYHRRMGAAERRRIAAEKLALVELPEVYDRPTSALSGGQRKRVSLARAIVLEPDVVLFDEPNSGLDPMTSGTVDALIQRMKEQLGVTFVVITHDIVQAVTVADWIGMLSGGHLVAYGPTETFLQSDHPTVRAFLSRKLPEGT
ncbi:MAG: ATP-binding cassette domain-containing protein [Alphaproteobacteria bacterium]|nr:ATP-binding cassette domain-containing protein [Alphaproteobacteria bacterium]MCB9693485.1 ATP-binding cassette domain-containing protein [Alphaproteobacteria bacterium]